MNIFNNKLKQEESTELQIYLEKFKNRKLEGDFKTAMEIALRINWNHVNDSALFIDAAEVFEKMEDYPHAKKLYEDAYVHSKSKERILYPLCIVSIKAGELEDGMLFYEEFCIAYPDDIRKDKLKYLILKYKKAQPLQLLRVVEDYFDGGGDDEEMMFEAANIYAALGRKEECVDMCDKLVMYYDVQNFGKAALELKQKFTPISKEQLALLDEYFLKKDSSLVKRKLFDYNPTNENPEVIDSQNLRTIVQNRTDEEEAQIQTKKEEEAKEKIKQDFDMGESYQASNESTTKFDEIGGAFLEEKDHFEHITLSDLQASSDELNAEKETKEREKIEKSDLLSNEHIQRPYTNTEENFETSKDDETIVSTFAKEKNLQGTNSLTERKNLQEEKKPMEEIKKHNRTESDAAIENKLIKELSKETIQEFEQGTSQKKGYHMIIEGKSFKQCLAIAQNELKYIHSVLGNELKLAKVSADKINENGLFSYVTRLGDRDMIISSAGYLNDSSIDDITSFIDIGKYKNIIVLCDLVDNFDSIAKMHPEFIKLFDIVSVEVSKVKEDINEEDIVQIDLNDEDYDIHDVQDKNNTYKKSNIEEKEVKKEELRDWEKAVEQKNKVRVLDDSHPEDFEKIKSSKKSKKQLTATAKQKQNEKNIRQTPNNKDEEMEVADFAAYCRRYADSIDCVISGKTIAALYERIELMEEDGIKLTKKSAIDLIDETADIADRTNILRGIFKSKYDKTGRLILRSEHFLKNK